MTSTDRRAVIASAFDRAAADYDSLGVDYFSRFAAQLLDDLAPQPGERVLDIGCGRGAVLFRAAELVGPQGSVTGIDFAPGMVEHTAAEIAERGVGNASVHVMDAQEPLLPKESIDVAVAALVAFFLPDPLAGLRAWRDLLVPGGRLGLTTFCGGDPRWDPVSDLFAPYVPASVSATMTDRSNPFASDANLAAALVDAGFAEPVSVPRWHQTRFTGPAHWVDWSWSHGQRLTWELVPAQQRDAVRAEAIARLTPACNPDGSLTMHQGVRYTTARRP